MYVCLCKGLTETDVQQVMRGGQVCPETLKMCFGLEDDDCCCRCAKNIHELVAVANSVSSLTSALPMFPHSQG